MQYIYCAQGPPALLFAIHITQGLPAGQRTSQCFICNVITAAGRRNMHILLQFLHSITLSVLSVKQRRILLPWCKWFFLNRFSPAPKATSPALSAAQHLRKGASCLPGGSPPFNNQLFSSGSSKQFQTRGWGRSCPTPGFDVWLLLDLSPSTSFGTETQAGSK